MSICIGCGNPGYVVEDGRCTVCGTTYGDSYAPDRIDARVADAEPWKDRIASLEAEVERLRGLLATAETMYMLTPWSDSYRKMLREWRNELRALKIGSGL